MREDPPSLVRTWTGYEISHLELMDHWQLAFNTWGGRFRAELYCNERGFNLLHSWYHRMRFVPMEFYIPKPIRLIEDSGDPTRPMPLQTGKYEGLETDFGRIDIYRVLSSPHLFLSICTRKDP